MLDLTAANELCRLLGDPTRVRMLVVLAHESLSVAEMTQVTGLAQSRVSTHLGRLKEVGLVEVRREGTASYYSAVAPERCPGLSAVWGAIATQLEDPLLEADRERASALVTARHHGGKSWSASIAGHMERYYSPGRTWQAFVRALVGFAALGDVLDVGAGDGALAELLAPHCRSLTCLDIDKKVTDAGSERLKRFGHVRCVQGDMHALSFTPGSFDQVLLMNALTYAEDPQAVLVEAGRMLRGGGRLIGGTLASHKHHQAVMPFGHIQFGFAPQYLRDELEAAGLQVSMCEVTHTERRAPHFEVITFHAVRPA
ncbi:MAG: metalloregulator ArsR/SmtB family transcription factor [Myxococcales bacterium]|nr:metalloregulator ArsR/SmtB family transcription factor [Myxococcales bacterium]